MVDPQRRDSRNGVSAIRDAAATRWSIFQIRTRSADTTATWLMRVGDLAVKMEPVGDSTSHVKRELDTRSEPGEPTVDQELVMRARGGDKDAFAALVTPRLGRMQAMARLILHDETLAEDALQDALIDAWRDLRGLRDPARFDAWLHRVTVHACYSHARRQSRYRVKEISVTSEDEIAPNDAARALELTDELERGLRRLPTDQRALLVLVYYLDLPVAEAAGILGIPFGTAKSRLHRAIGRLRAELAAVAREAPMAREGVA